MTATRHDLDAHAWATETAALIRAGRLEDVDFEHVAEELESMGAAERNALNSRMTELLLHLLKWRFQPERHGASWEVSIIKQRNGIADLLETSPSLRPRLLEVLAKAWPRALRLAVAETRLPLASFPEDCPFTLEEVLAAEFWPEAER
ncbi:MAG: DUF29 domain-containing protein [Nitrospira sp.]|nr:DUF29 domain-containing protein [Nitrospira sp.]